MRRVSKYEHAFRAGRGEPVELVEHPEDAPAPAPAPAPLLVEPPIAIPAPAPEATSDDPAAVAAEIEAALERPDPTAASSETPPAAPAAVAADPLVVMFESSNVRAATLDAPTGVLTVEFNNGKRYRYGNFTAELLAEWRGAKSAGSWFHANVKTQPARHPLLPAAPGK